MIGEWLRSHVTPAMAGVLAGVAWGLILILSCELVRDLLGSGGRGGKL